ncbi:MAG TPA: DUF4352 domain-containing protein [Acidimicrobiales bacterium]|nr:DUF4352 domain-containing protein [Acidimicrobiales bacterium]
MTTELRCFKHNTPTQLSCAQCERPCCTRCLVWTEVGQKCTTCVPHRSSKRGVGRLVAAVLLLTGLVAAGVGVTKLGSTRSKPLPAENASLRTAKLGQPVSDGGLTFVVHRFDCPLDLTTVDNPLPPATGRYCRLDLEATNSGKLPATFSTRAQMLLDAQRRRFAADPVATAIFHAKEGDAFTSFTVQTMNPGADLRMSIVYDIPAGAAPTKAELHSGATLGVTVTLTP